MRLLKCVPGCCSAIAGREHHNVALCARSRWGAPSSQRYPCRHVRVPWLEMLDRTVMATTGTSPPRRVYADSPFVTQWNLTNLVCFKHAVATGATGYVVRVHMSDIKLPSS